VSARARFSRVAALALLVGLALFAYTVYRTGPAAVLAHVGALGVWFPVLLLISSVRQVLRTLAWRLCIAPEHRTVPFLDLARIRLAGEAVTSLTFAGPLLGETAKAVVVSRRIPAAHSVPSIVIENYVYTLSVTMVIAAGAGALLFGFALPREAFVAGETAGAVAAVLALAGYLAIRRRWRLVGAIVAWASRRPLAGRKVRKYGERILRVEETLLDFANGGPFFRVLALELASSLPGILEAYLILHLTTGRGSFVVALVVESVYRVINTIFSFVPLRVGVDEGGTGLLLHVLGIGAAEGVALAIIRKIRTLVWTGVGLADLGRMTLAARDGERPAPPDRPA
jgi:hypothetical protein